MLPGSQSTERVFSSAASDPRFLRVTALGEVTSVGPAGRTSILITSGSHSLTVPVSIVAGPAHRVEPVEGTNSAIVAGAPSSVSIRLMDAFDNPVANSEVMIEAAIKPKISLSTVTDTNGVATIALPVITECGPLHSERAYVGNPPVSLPLDMQVERGFTGETSRR